MGRRVVVTGVGMVTPLGLSADETWAGLMNSQSGIRKLTEFEEKHPLLPVKIAGRVDGLNKRALFETDREAAELDNYIAFAISSADEAMKQAGFTGPLDKDLAERTACVVGVGLAGYQSVLRTYDALRTGGASGVPAEVLANLTSNLVPAYVGRRFGLRGINYTTVSACTSGAHGAGEGFLLIKEGRADVVIAGGCEAGVDPLTVAGFAAMRALSSSHNDDPTHASRPFEKNRDGFVLGEGCGCLVLEEYEHAKARGANILCEMVGYGASEDAHHITAPSENGEGAQRSMRQALRSAGMAPEDVSYINAHGTSTPLNDVNEAKAIRAVFGDKWCDNGLLVSSTKSMTGHLLGGAGGIEAVISVLSIVKQKVPPTINYDEPDPEIVLDVVPNVARDARVRAVLSNAFGFGGTNGSILFSELQ